MTKRRYHRCERCGFADKNVHKYVAQKYMETVFVWAHPHAQQCIELLREDRDYYKEKLQHIKSERD